MLTHVARSVGGRPRSTRAFVVRRWSFLRDSSVDHFRVRLVGVHTEAEISCATRINLRKRKKADGASEDALPFGLTLGPVAKRISSSVAPERSGGAGIAPGDALESDEDSARDLEVARSWSSEAGSEPEDSIVAESSAHSDAVEDEPWNAMGVKAWDIAPPRARVLCCVCNLKIVAGLVRIDYRFRVSNDLRDQRRCHAGCVGTVSIETRNRDGRVVRQWLRDDALEPRVGEGLEEASYALSL